MSELQKRILTALVLIPVVLLLVFGLDTFYFSIAMTLVLVLGAWEWCRLSGIAKPTQQILPCLLMVFLALLSSQIEAQWVYALAALWWCFAFYLVITFPKSESVWKGRPIVQYAIGVMILIPTWMGIIELQADSPWKMLFVFMLVWAADIGAYFFGRAFGKHKLAPNVSPGKSIEGLLGGFVVAIVIGLGLKSFVGLEALGVFQAVAVFAAVVIFSVLGDLSESLFKRSQGLKDSSQLLPGHGGILDRIDSLCSAVPIYFVMMGLLG